MSQGIELLCDSHHGQFIPQIMASRLQDNGWIGLGSCVDDCTDPTNEFYWEAWEQILSNASFADENKNTWYLWQDGDLFAYCEELMTSEEKQHFFDD